MTGYRDRPNDYESVSQCGSSIRSCRQSCLMSLQTSETSSVLSISRFHRISPVNCIVRVGHCWLMMIPSLTLFPVHLTAVIDTVSMRTIILVGEFLARQFPSVADIDVPAVRDIILQGNLKNTALI